MSDEDISLDEKRVFEGRRDETQVFVATGLGLARVAVSDDQIGRFGLVYREGTRDVAVDASEGTVAIATDADVLVGDGESFEPTDFGPAAAVTFADGVVAADSRGRVSRREDGEWNGIAALSAPVAAMDGDLVATEGGVYRIEPDGLAGVALAGVRDVAGEAGLAATAEGVYRLADGIWTAEARGDGTRIAGDGRAAAVVDGDVLERADEAWTATDCPADDVADLAVGRGLYVVAPDGTLHVDPPAAKDGAEGWASRSLGLTDVAAVAVLPATERGPDES